MIVKSCTNLLIHLEDDGFTVFDKDMCELYQPVEIIGGIFMPVEFILCTLLAQNPNAAVRSAAP